MTRERTGCQVDSIVDNRVVLTRETIVTSDGIAVRDGSAPSGSVAARAGHRGDHSWPGDLAPQAVLWDMDGTLIDTEPYWLAAEQELVAEFGGSWTYDDGLAIVGWALPQSAKVLADHGVDLPTDQIIDRLTASVARKLAAEVPWRVGAREALARLAERGIPCALVTMSYRNIVAELVAALPEGTFSAVVTGEDVRRGKPDPEPYLRAAEMLGVDIALCVAFEDSVPGISSALASGAATVAVRNIVPVIPRPGLSRLATLECVDDGFLGHVLSGGVVDELGDLD